MTESSATQFSTNSNHFQICDSDLTEAALVHYLQAGAIAIDTETMGLNPWRDRLCLVQISDKTDHVTVIRIVQGQTNAPNLHQLMESPLSK